MGEILSRVLTLIKLNDVRISEHGYDELADDGIMAHDIIQGSARAIEVEEYPDYPKGPCVLVLQHDTEGRPLHVVWGIPRGTLGPAVLVTAYRPTPKLWSDDFTRRKR